jgi:hypothetical protein
MAGKDDSDPIRLDKILAKRVDCTDGTVIYQGMAEIGTLDASSTWQIKRTTITGAIIEVEFAEGEKDFKYIWDNRASLTYS